MDIRDPPEPCACPGGTWPCGCGAKHVVYAPSTANADHGWHWGDDHWRHSCLLREFAAVWSYLSTPPEPYPAPPGPDPDPPVPARCDCDNPPWDGWPCGCGSAAGHRIHAGDVFTSGVWHWEGEHWAADCLLQAIARLAALGDPDVDPDVAAYEAHPIDEPDDWGDVGQLHDPVASEIARGHAGFYRDKVDAEPGDEEPRLGLLIAGVLDLVDAHGWNATSVTLRLDDTDDQTTRPTGVNITWHYPPPAPPTAAPTPAATWPPDDPLDLPAPSVIRHHAWDQGWEDETPLEAGAVQAHVATPGGRVVHHVAVRLVPLDSVDPDGVRTLTDAVDATVDLDEHGQVIGLAVVWTDEAEGPPQH
jgi:hypothetical protein